MRRKVLGVMPAYIKTLDCCLNKPYFYSSYKDEQVALETSEKKKIIIIGSGPNRIGQGSESDYVCIHTSKTLQEEGYETIIVNSSPSTVATAFGVSDKLYIEPLTAEDVLGVIEYEKPDGIVMTTALDFYKDLLKAGVKILGSSDKSIKIIEDRKLFSDVLKKLDLKQSEYEIAKSEKRGARKSQRNWISGDCAKWQIIRWQIN